MEKKINSTRNKKLVVKSRSVPVGIEKFLPSKQVEFLDSFKMSLETLLDSIKNCQIQLLSISGKDKNKSIKALLNELIEELDFSLNEKESNAKYLEKNNSKITIPLQNKIFIENKKCKDNNIYSNKKNINIYNLKSETELLKMLNFKVENEIKQLDNTMSAKVDEYEYLNIYLEDPFIEEKINICSHQKDFLFVDKLLQSKLEKKSKKLKLMLSLKQYNNEQIKLINQNINKLKNMLSYNTIDNNIITEEESKDSNNISTHALYDINHILLKYYYQKQCAEDEDENEDDNIIILNNESKNDINNSRASDENESKNNIQQMINYNMDVNLNINYGNFFCNDNMTYNNDRNKNSKKFHNNKNNKDYLCSSNNSLNDSIKM